ncbi:skin secretory protein xP2-like [Procambarus clarkii]|uniref:skin secretory protein xP2-like n=1 Tax=Procambarus clarkii TaxID=6728 RepID=UPI0037423121
MAPGPGERRGKAPRAAPRGVRAERSRPHRSPGAETRPRRAHLQAPRDARRESKPGGLATWATPPGVGTARPGIKEPARPGVKEPARARLVAQAPTRATGEAVAPGTTPSLAARATPPDVAPPTPRGPQPGREASQDPRGKKAVRSLATWPTPYPEHGHQGTPCTSGPLGARRCTVFLALGRGFPCPRARKPVGLTT